ncbi:MAG: radical SAM protein [Candidatus Hermodarchaeota archaeon]
MNETKYLLQKINSEEANWEDFSKILQLEGEDFDPFLDLAQKLTYKNFDNTLKIYIPNKRFPAISITGEKCALHCEHCNEKYLVGMKPILDTIELKNYLLSHAQNKGIGVLISGGCESNGSVPLYKFLDTIKKVKNETSLIINTHTGLLNEETAKKLAEANVDIVSFDINMDKEIIQNIYHLDKDLKEYERAINLLKKNSLNIVPHICVGLY